MRCGHWWHCWSLRCSRSACWNAQRLCFEHHVTTNPSRTGLNFLSEARCYWKNYVNSRQNPHSCHNISYKICARLCSVLFSCDYIISFWWTHWLIHLRVALLALGAVLEDMVKCYLSGTKHNKMPTVHINNCLYVSFADVALPIATKHINIMTSSNGNIFRVTGPLCGEFTGHWWIPLTKAGGTELLRSLWPVREQTVRQTSRRWWLSLWRHCNERANRAHKRLHVCDICSHVNLSTTHIMYISG